MKVYILHCGEAFEGINISSISNTWEKALVAAHNYMECSDPDNWEQIDYSTWKQGSNILKIEEWWVDE